MGEGLKRVVNEIRLSRATDGTRHPAKYMKCSKRQVEAFEAIAIGHSAPPSICDKLVEKGLLERGPDALVDFLPGHPMRVKTYTMPIYIHMAWCEWCSKQPDVIEEANRD